MKALLFVGPRTSAANATALLEHGSYSVTLLLEEDATADVIQRLHPAVVVRPIPSPTGAGGQFLMLDHLVPWIAWNLVDDPALALRAYQAGASAVLPRDSTAAVLARAVDKVLDGLPSAGSPAPRPPAFRRYHRGDTIPLAEGEALEILEGVLALTTIHADGTEVLLGVHGAGQVLLGHPADGCCIVLLAHTDAQLSVRPWSEVAGEPQVVERLRVRIRQLETWVAIQARPYLDQRLLGVLSVLAEQFGVPHPRGTLLTVRLTHTQLAAALGANRTTVTRLLGDLRLRGLVVSVESADGERLCLCAPTREPGRPAHLV